jgi:nitrite reductase/ring-hydroxylating ferredoxin subunit
MDVRRSEGRDARPLAYSGYHRNDEGTSDLFLTQVGRGTPGGEYLRRFWQPICLLAELTDVPRRERALGEDIVVFRDKSGRVGVLHLSCCHRGTSLEFGRIEQQGIRCCYHGRLFDVDGTILEVPGDPNEKRIQGHLAQGAYPAHVHAGIVFAYMGPPQEKPAFPQFDHFDLPGVRLALPIRLPFACNWVQIKENALDPAHTAILHAWEDRFADQFGVFPEFEFSEAPGGAFYVAVRRAGENIWMRSTSVIMPHVHIISSVLENGRQMKPASPPYMSFFTLPVDDVNSVSFAIPHVTDGESLERRMAFGWVGTGQTPERPYHERQRIPGDYDAQVGQGPIEKHSKEHLGYHDRGVVLFRRMLRRGIEAVQRGEPVPARADGPIPSFGTDRVVPVSTVEGNPDDREVWRELGRATVRDYLQRPPMSHLRAPAG